MFETFCFATFFPATYCQGDPCDTSDTDCCATQSTGNEAFCDSITEVSSPSLEQVCPIISVDPFITFSGQLIADAKTTKCAGSSCTIEDIVCCVRKTKEGGTCAVFNISLELAGFRDASEGPYTGKVINDAATTRCFNGYCDINSVSTCCEVDCSGYGGYGGYGEESEKGEPSGIGRRLANGYPPDPSAQCRNAYSATCASMDGENGLYVLCSGSLSYSGGLIAAAKTTDCSETPCGPNDVSTCCARATAPSPSPRSSSTTSSEQQQGEPNQGAGGSGKAGGLRRALESTLNNDHSFACSTCPIGKRNKHFCCQHDLVLQIQQSLIPFFQFFLKDFINRMKQQWRV
jgi:hypothetical protein